jgi:hypothetical protein
MTTAEAFEIVCAKNALRRESGLPLLSVRRAVEAELRAAQMRAFAAAADRYRAVYMEMRASVIRDRRSSLGHDLGRSLSGRWRVDCEAWPRFEKFLASKGYRRPQTGVVYGKEGG